MRQTVQLAKEMGEDLGSGQILLQTLRGQGMTRIAIIGAGISGLVLAQQLAAHAEVIVFEKARGVGGRMSTRYAAPFYFDHGAQCFTARSHEFQSFLKPYMDEGIVSEWHGKVINLEIGKKQTKRLWFEPHLVASPNMNSLCKALPLLLFPD